MKNKAILTSLIAGVCCLALAGTVSAATCFTTGVNGTPSAPTKDINIYGASAQQVFWTTEAPNYLQAAGCIPGDGSAANAANWAANSATDAASNPSHFVVRALCGPGHATLVNFRVSSKASYDGPVAVDDSPTVYGDTSCGVLNQRPLLHGGIAACPWGSTACGAPTAARGDCAVVNWGASDVAVGDFQQASYGTPPRNFVANPVTLNTAVDFCHPEAVAFGFYVNNSV